MWSEPICSATLRLPARGVRHTDRKSTRLNSSHEWNLVCRLLLEKKKLAALSRGQTGRVAGCSGNHDGRVPLGGCQYTAVRTGLDVGRRGVCPLMIRSADTRLC